MSRGLSKIIVLTVVVTMAMFAFGCSGQSSTSSTSDTSGKSETASASGATTEASEPVDLILDEAGYSVGSSGFVYYGFKLTNPNSGHKAQFPAVTITGKAADGSIVFSDEQIMMDIFPGESIVYGFQAGNGTAPETVDFSVSVGKSNWNKTDEIRSDLYTVTNTSEVEGDYGNVNYTGEITLNKEFEAAEQPAITLILRDDAGKIIYGTTTFLMSELSVGQAKAFDISGYDLPAHTSYEITATPWM